MSFDLESQAKPWGSPHTQCVCVIWEYVSGNQGRSGACQEQDRLLWIPGDWVIGEVYSIAGDINTGKGHRETTPKSPILNWPLCVMKMLSWDPSEWGSKDPIMAPKSQVGSNQTTTGHTNQCSWTTPWWNWPTAWHAKWKQWKHSLAVQIWDAHMQLHNVSPDDAGTLDTVPQKTDQMFSTFALF